MPMYRYRKQHTQPAVRTGIIHNEQTTKNHFSATNCLAFLRCGRILHTQCCSMLRRISVGPPMFSVQEIDLLQQSWRHMTGPRKDFGGDLYFQLLKNEPGLAKAIDLDLSKPETWKNSVEFTEEGHRIADLFQSILSDLTPNSSKFDLRPDIRQVGAAHHRLNITLRNQSFCLFKSYVLAVVNECPIRGDWTVIGTRRHSQHNSCDRDVRNRAWEKLICCIIEELKSAYEYEKSRHMVRRHALHEVGTGEMKQSKVNIRLTGDQKELMSLTTGRLRLSPEFVEEEGDEVLL